MPTEAEIAQLSDEAFKQLKQAVAELVTVKVTTLVGDASFAQATGQAAGTQGAVTEVNMATGDITAAYSDRAAGTADLRALHEAALSRGTDIFLRNIAMLKDLVLALSDRVRG